MSHWIQTLHLAASLQCQESEVGDIILYFAVRHRSGHLDPLPAPVLYQNSGPIGGGDFYKSVEADNSEADSSKNQYQHCIKAQSSMTDLILTSGSITL